MRSQTYSVSVVLLFVTFRTIVAYSDDLHHQPDRDRVTNDHQSKEPHTVQVRNHPLSSPGCPQRCSCKKNGTDHVISVDCSSNELKVVPDLPETTIELSLRNNSISYIPCKSFKLLLNLENLNLAFNKIKSLLSCVFVSQSSSLLNLKISDNDIKVLDVKLFQNLSHLETLDLSCNLITHLASRTFSDLVQLVNLNLSFNHIKSISPNAFRGLHSLKNLSLQNNKLDSITSFHKNVFQDLGALEMLDVKANLGSIDEAVSALKNVSHLYMMVFYRRTILGTGFRELTSLRVLNLNSVYFSCDEKRYQPTSDCILGTVPSKFFGNIRTEKDFKLYLSDCSFTMKGRDNFLFPSTLVALDISHNMNSDSINGSWMESLISTKINYLDLSWTWDISNPQYIPDGYFTYLSKTNVKTLVFKKNSLAVIEEIKFPYTVEKLDISDNSIMLSELYYAFTCSHQNDYKLKELLVSDQHDIVRMAEHISQQTSDANIVGDLNASNTSYKSTGRAGRRSSLSKLPNGLFVNGSQTLRSTTMHKTINSRHATVVDAKLPKVFNKAKLNCEHNLVKQGPDIQIISLPPDLEVMYANSAIDLHDFKRVPHIRIVNNTVLRHVELADNPLTTLLGPVENVPSLQLLNLSRNQCNNLGVDFFKYMVNLQTLILDSNFIGASLAADVIGLTFSPLTNLKLLDISQNFIKDLSSSAFIHNRNLEVLNLSNNQLSGFQPSISTILNMSVLDLSVNLLPGLREQTCDELKLLKFRKPSFTVNLLDNRLLFTCEYLPFLHLVLSKPGTFFHFERLKFKCAYGTQFSYKELAHRFPLLARECLVQRFFDVILTIFFIVGGTVGFFAVIYHKRWKLRYLYYTSRRRMHIGEHVVDYTPEADVFLTYDQDDLRWRRFMQQTFLPGLNQRNITYILGEIDFPGGDIMAHVTGAVVGTRKTVVLLSAGIFDDHHREFEMNLAIMREMDTRSLQIVPIFVEEIDLALYPREIEIFLQNQWQRCLRYRDSDDFWDGFVDAVREDN